MATNEHEWTQIKKGKGKRAIDPHRPLLKKERGVWVYQSEMPDVSIVELIDQERETRLQDLMGTAKNLTNGE